MASSYTTNKSIEKPAYNDYAANPTGWSGPINTDWDIIDKGFGGVLSKNATGSVGTVNLTSTETQNLIINITGVMTGNAIYTLPANSPATGIVAGQWIVYNNTTGNYTVTVSPVSGGGTSVVCAQGLQSCIYSDGTNIEFADSRIQPGGSNTQIQFKSSGTFSGSPKMTFDGTTTSIDKLNVATTLGVSGAATVNSLSVTTTAAVTGTITGSSTISDSIGNVRDVPINSKTTSYVLLASDAGKFISITTGGVTVPAGIFAVGQVVTIYNNSGTSQTITQGTGTSLRLAGFSTTGDKTLAGYGLATMICVASNTFAIGGGGVS